MPNSNPTLIKSGGMTFSPNTEKAFDAVVQYNDSLSEKKYPILGPNIMVTKSNDILLNHDDFVSSEGVTNIQIRNLDRAAIKQLQITDVVDEQTYELQYMFLDEFMPKYFLDYGVFFDIKNRTDSGVSSETTAKVLLEYLLKLKNDNNSQFKFLDDTTFWNKIYFDSDNPEVIRQILKFASTKNLKLNTMYDYNNFGINCCVPFYDCVFWLFDTLNSSNTMALEKEFVTQKRIDGYKNKNKKILVWNIGYDEASAYFGIDFVLV
jgi:hypothetical protein